MWQPNDWAAGEMAMTSDVNAKRVWMIVEDEPSLRMMLSTAMMLMWGIEPLAFDDGYDAMAWLDRIEAQRDDAMLPELALLDIRMPGPQGPEIAERLRKVPATSKMAIVMMTAYRLNTEERESILKMAKPQAMLSKPLPRLGDLKQALEQAIDSTRTNQSGSGQAVAGPRPSVPRSGI
jgi:CheY-like chemotaxis protein